MYPTPARHPPASVSCALYRLFLNLVFLNRNCAKWSLLCGISRTSIMVFAKMLETVIAIICLSRVTWIFTSRFVKPKNSNTFDQGRHQYHSRFCGFPNYFHLQPRYIRHHYEMSKYCNNVWIMPASRLIDVLCYFIIIKPTYMCISFHRSMKF